MSAALQNADPESVVSRINGDGGPACCCCTHLQRAALDAAVIRGDSDLTIGKLFGISHDSVRRHRERHLKRELRHALAVRGRTWTKRVDRLARVLERQIDCNADPEIVQKTASTLNGTLRMLGEAAGEFPKADLNVLILNSVGAPVDLAKRAVEMSQRVSSASPEDIARAALEALDDYCRERGLTVEEARASLAVR